MRELILGLAGALSLAAVSAQAQSYRIEEHGGGLGVFVDLSIVVSKAGGQGWVAERVRRDRHWCGDRSSGTCKPTDLRRHDWIDGNACPQLVEALRDLAAVTPPRFASPDLEDYWTSADTTLLTISGPREGNGVFPGAGFEENLSISELDGRYRAWWEVAKQRLDGCWRPDAPVIAGKSLVPQLADLP